MATTTLTQDTTYNVDQIIAAGDTLRLDPTKTIKVTLDNCSLVIRGKLESRPASASVVHTFEWINLSEDAFLGAFDHDNPQYDTDPGLWVLPRGQLDVYGTVKLPWTLAATGVAAGIVELALAQDPTGWQIGDQVVIVPTAPLGSPAFDQFEERTVADVRHKGIRLDKPLDHDHPEVSLGRGRTQTAEVLNLTRNVVMKGTASGRTHVIIHAHRNDHNFGYVRTEHMGPHNTRAQALHWPDTSGTQIITHAKPVYGGKADRVGKTKGDPFRLPVLARWPVHFHHEGEDSRGQEIEGLVGYKNGSHDFVFHESHGMTARYCISYGSMTGPFWWDGLGTAGDTKRRTRPPDRTFDATWDRCVAAKTIGVPDALALAFENVFAPGWSQDDLRPGHDITVWPGGKGPGRMGAFDLGRGDGHLARGCVAVGMDAGEGGLFASGFVWQEGGFGEWTLEDCVSHNNRQHGIFAWINTPNQDIIDRFVAFHNAQDGVFWGAYVNSPKVRNCIFTKNGRFGWGYHANSGGGGQLIEDCLIDSFVGDSHNLEGDQPVRVHNCEIAKVVIDDSRAGRAAANIEFVDCAISSYTTIPESRSHIERYNEDGFKPLSALPAQLLPQVDATTEAPDPAPEPDPDPPPVYFLRFSFFDDRSQAQVLEGAELRDTVYVFLGGDPDVADVTQVQWKLDGVNGVLDTASPFDYKDTAGGGEANPWDTTAEDDGDYVITAVITDPVNGDQTLTANVTISNPVEEEQGVVHSDFPVIVERSTPFPPGELLTDNESDVETDTTGFSAENAGTFQRVTSQSHNNAASLEITTPGSVNREGVQIAGKTAVAAGNRIALSYWMKAASGTPTVAVGIREMDAVPAEITTTFGTGVTLSTTEWKLVSVLVDSLDANVDSIQPLLVTDGIQAITFYADNGHCQKIAETDIAGMLVSVQAAVGNLLRITANGSIRLHSATGVIGRLRLVDTEGDAGDRELARWAAAAGEETDDRISGERSAHVAQPDEPITFKLTVIGAAQNSQFEEIEQGTIVVDSADYDHMQLVVEDLGPLPLTPTGDDI